MEFEHEGSHYRIVFRYSKLVAAPRRWIVEEIPETVQTREGEGLILWNLATHERSDIRVVREIAPKTAPRRKTTCEIQQWDEVRKWYPVEGMAGATACSHQDQFRKEYARRASLARALAVVDEPSEFYGKVMAAYYGRKKGRAK